MTVRLYRDNSYLWQFTAQVRKRLDWQGHPALLLDQTAFYPSAGGQPFDTGTLNGARVIDVAERDDGEIVHVLDAPLNDDTVQGEVDGVRRMDHMQQHSGQHVLSAAFVDTANLDTVSVHIGAGDCTLDLPTPVARLSAEALARAEDEANRIVFEDRPLIVREMSDAEAAQLPLRKPPTVSGRIRIVEVADYDWSACGGTHVRSTGQIGLIKVLRAEKRGDLTRVSFRCGGRALADYRDLSALAAALGESLRMSRAEIAGAVERLRDEARASRKALSDAQTRLMDYEVQDLLRAASAEQASRRVIARVFDARDANALKGMAKRLTAEPSVIALLGGIDANRVSLCFARAGGVGQDMAALLRGAIAQMQMPTLKGGGSPEFAQGSGPLDDGAAAQQALQRALEWAAQQIAASAR
jgi:alanyl-tRNA synthetase